MFAAAATVAATVFNLSKSIGKFIALKLLLIGLLIVVLPWVLKDVFGYCFKYLLSFIEPLISFLNSQLSQLTGGSYDFSIQLTGIGGYLAEQIGLVEYCTIIFTGWAAYLAIVTTRKFIPWM